MMGVMDMPTFESMVNTLVNTGLVKRAANHVLAWVEPIDLGDGTVVE